MSDDFSAATALAALQDSRAAWAGRSKGKGAQWEALYGLFVGVVVGGQALPLPFNITASLGGGALIGLASLYWARRNGVWINGTGPRRARWVSLGFGLLLLLAAGAVYWAASRGMAWVGWPAGILAGLLGMLAARLWRWVYRSDIADGTDAQPSRIGHRPYGLMVGFGVFILALASLVALLTHNLGSQIFFYVLGAGVGVILASLVMALVQRLLFRGPR